MEEAASRNTNPTDPVINPALGNIRQEWDWVRRGIDEVLHLDPNATYRAEDVYAACVNGDAHLWTHPEGFVVTTFQWCKYSGRRTLMVWVAWALERGNSVAVKCRDFFEQLAVEQQCTDIEIITRHQKVADYVSENLDGWETKYMVLGKDLRG